LSHMDCYHKLFLFSGLLPLLVPECWGFPQLNPWLLALLTVQALLDDLTH
jgi:hypothetical protein